jgi:hypothetical protein
VGPALRRRKTNQETVLALLKHRKGTTIAGIIKATGWQEHSVRSFLVTIVLKKLGFALSSETVDGARVYRITAPIASKRTRAVAQGCQAPIDATERLPGRVDRSCERCVFK